MYIFNLKKLKRFLDIYIRGVSYKWYASVAGQPNLYLVIDGWCTLKVEHNCDTENTFYMKQAVSKFDKVANYMQI